MFYNPVIASHTNHFGVTGTLELERVLEDGVKVAANDRAANDNSLPSPRATVLRVTPDHPMHHASRGWVHTGQLSVGDLLTGDEPGERFRVTHADFTAAQSPHAAHSLTYNLSVADTHSYFVGEDGVLAHNGGAKDFIRRLIPIIGPTAAEFIDIDSCRINPDLPVRPAPITRVMDPPSPPPIYPGTFRPWITPSTRYY